MLDQASDVVIIGGGIVGTAIARELARYDLRVILLEEKPDIAMGTTKANSGILHAGYDCKPGTLKAQLNVRGNQLYHDIQDELGLHIRWCGSLVVAISKRELKSLEQLLQRGRSNDVTGIEQWNRDRTLQFEPNLTPDVYGALFAPSAGIICPYGAAIAFAENAILNGVTIVRNCPVTGIRCSSKTVNGVHTGQGIIKCRFVVNAAGIYADEVARMAGDDSFTITPRKGQYVLFDRTMDNMVRSVLFPVPTRVSKGILVAPTVDGNMFAGPDAHDQQNRQDTSTNAQGLEQVIRGARTLIPSLPLTQSITTFAGLRAVAGEDFIIRSSKKVRGLFHVAGIQSPGLTAAPAVGEYVVDLLRDQGLILTHKKKFNPCNPKWVRTVNLVQREKEALIAQRPEYGHVICRCEQVTEGELIDAIHRPCGATTLDGIKRRTRTGMGRCQGSFCGPKVAAILARELNIPITEVQKDEANSNLYLDRL